MDQPIHLMTGSSTVKCGAPMRHWKTQPDGWDLGTATADAYKVTCPDCIPSAAR